MNWVYPSGKHEIIFDLLKIPRNKMVSSSKGVKVIV